MKILVINPNTSENFNKLLEKSAISYKLPDTKVKVISPDYGPKSIEGIYDESLSIMGTVEAFIKNKDDYDGFVIACFSDHLSVYAIREITEKPVLGIAEAGIYLSCMLGEKFSIVTTNERWEPLLMEAVRKYGVEKKCASVRTTGMRVLELEESGKSVEDMIENEAEKAIKEDGAEVICLGCAGMSGLDKRLQKNLNVPVVDGFIAALKMIEIFNQYGVSHSKILTYAKPQEKDILNLNDIYKNAYK